VGGSRVPDQEGSVVAKFFKRAFLMQSPALLSKAWHFASQSVTEGAAQAPQQVLPYSLPSFEI
jgi:hypothetical protein